MRHEVEVIDEYSVFSVVPARSAAGWLAGWAHRVLPPPLLSARLAAARCVV